MTLDEAMARIHSLEAALRNARHAMNAVRHGDDPPSALTPHIVAVDSLVDSESETDVKSAMLATADKWDSDTRNAQADRLKVADDLILRFKRTLYGQEHIGNLSTEVDAYLDGRSQSKIGDVK